MTVSEELKTAKDKMAKSVDALKDEYATVSAGRANPALFSKVSVDYYGTPTLLQQLATFQVQDARTILMTPFDSSVLKDIERAFADSELGGNASNDGKAIRVVLPELTEDRRKDYIKIVKDKAENAKVSVRNLRRSAKENIDKLVKDKEIGEDEGSTGQKDLENLTKKNIDEIDEILKNKEQEVLEV